MKICIKCKIEKDISEFSINNKLKGYRCSCCKSCKAEAAREYRRSLKYKKYRETYTKTDRYIEKDKKSKINYNKTTKYLETRKRYGRYYNQTDNGVIVQLLKGIKERSKRNDRDSDITKEWIVNRLSTGCCEVTGIPFDLTLNKDYSRNPFRPSIDRIDSTKGYLQDNCKLVISMYNYCKNEWKHEDVMRMVKALYEKEHTDN